MPPCGVETTRGGPLERSGCVTPNLLVPLKDGSTLRTSSIASVDPSKFKATTTALTRFQTRPHPGYATSMFIISIIQVVLAVQLPNVRLSSHQASAEVTIAGILFILRRWLSALRGIRRRWSLGAPLVSQLRKVRKRSSGIARGTSDAHILISRSLN